MKNLIIKSLFFFSFLVLAFTAEAQSILNALPNCHVSGNPNDITAMNTQNQFRECAVAKDTLTGNLYVYNHNLSVGSRWVLLSTSGNDGVITNLTFTGSGATRSYSVTRSIGSPINGTVNINDADSLATNEGSLTVLAGTGTTSVIQSNTSGSTNVTLGVTGSGLSITESGNTITLQNTSPDQPVSITAPTGISVIGGSYPNFTITSTEVDGLITNEGIIGVADVNATTKKITSNTNTATGVNVIAGTGMSIASSNNTNGGSITLTNSSPDLTVVLNKAGLIDVTGTYPTFTITSHTSLPECISNAAAKAAPYNLTAGMKYRCAAGSEECTYGTVREVY